MQRVTVPYRQKPGMMTPMPLLDVRLSHGDHSIQATALIDSGAMMCNLAVFCKALKPLPLLRAPMSSLCHQ